MNLTEDEKRQCRESYKAIAQFVSEMGLQSLAADVCVAKTLVEGVGLSETRAKMMAWSIKELHDALKDRIEAAIVAEV